MNIKLEDKLIQVLLRPIANSTGFYIDDKFVERVAKKVRSKKKKEITDQLLCATIIGEFLATYEAQRVEVKKNNIQ